MQKKYLILGLILLVLVVVLGFGLANNQSSKIVAENQNDFQIVNIGATLPLSGPFAYYGTQVQKALNIAFNEHQERLRRNKIVVNLKYEDNAGDKKQTVLNMQKLIGDDPVLVISSNTPLSQPLIPLAEENQVNLLALVTGAKDFAQGTRYVFRDAIQSYQEGQVLAQYLIDSGVNSVATIVVNDDYGLSAAKGVEEELGQSRLVAAELFENNTTDIRVQIQKNKKS